MEWATVAGTIAAGVAIVTGIYGVFIVFSEKPSKPAAQQPSVEAVSRRVDALQTRLSKLNAEVQALPAQGATDPTGARGAFDSAAVAAVDRSLRRIDSQFQALQQAIGNSPLKALELPLLRRDLDNVKASNQATANSLRGDIDRQYDLMKWVLGTLVLGVAGILATVYGTRRGGGSGGS